MLGWHVMTLAGFPVDHVTRALGDPAVASVEVVERFTASAAEVGKSATGSGLAAARCERRFFEHIAPLWDHPAPGLLGAHEADDGDRARLLLLTEDLGAAGYALATAASVTQLHAVVDTLVGFHARFWNDLPFDRLGAAEPSLGQSARAWPAGAIAGHAIAARDAAAHFADAGVLTADERAVLDHVLASWEARFVDRARAGQALTLIHGDFHLLGNVLFTANDPRLRVIDWSELKPGLGPHDLAYCLAGVPADDRPARDGALLRRYWHGLGAAGVTDYSWALCEWDYRFSLVTNLFQSVFQGSTFWFRRTAQLIRELNGFAALDSPPPLPRYA